jgi:hypothetical protein
MMTKDSVVSASSVERPEGKIAFQYIDESRNYIHVFGEPGVGKTTILDRVQRQYSEDAVLVRRNIRANHDINEVFRVVHHALFDALPEEKKEDGRKLMGGTITSPVGGAGLSYGTEEAEASRAQLEYRDSLQDLGGLLPDEQTLLVCIDDVHELSENEREIRGAIQEASELLPSNAVLITAGRLSWEALETSVSLSMFTEEQTVDFLQEVFPQSGTEEILQIHEQLGGHPMYIGLLAESNSGGELPEIPEHEVREEIEGRYLEFLGPDERRLLLATAPLEELNEEVCTQVIPDQYGFDQIAVSDILESLSTRTVVQEIGRNADGLKIYRVHDVFREYLQDRSSQLEASQRKACTYFAEKLIRSADEESTMETEVEYVTSLANHLSDSVISSETEVLCRLIEQTIADDKLRFYPSSLLISEFKGQDATQLPDAVVDSILSSVSESCNLANDFYDVDLDHSWAELQFERGAFADPDNNLLSYLNRTTETHPSFIGTVAEEIETDNERTLRFLIAIGEDLPVGDAAVIGRCAAEWIREKEGAYGYLAPQALKLVTYLVENDEYDVALGILDEVLKPRDVGDTDQLDLEQGMMGYNLTETIDDIFDGLIRERGKEFVDILDSNLDLALQQENGEYAMVAGLDSLDSLNYTDGMRGKLEEVVLEYFVRATTAWIEKDPSDDERKEFVKELLKRPTAFRRVGLYTLGEYPESFKDLAETELSDEANYQTQSPDQEFYHALSEGFEYLSNDVQNSICKIIVEGPYTDSIEDRATQLAEQGDESASYFEKRIRETWQRDRLCLIREHLDEEYSDRLDELLDKYGEPDRVPSETLLPEVTGGHVRQRGPEETEELREQPAEEVLSAATEWEPPETNHWETGDEGQLEEQNHLGFSRQLSELIKENPQRYAREISVLEDANPRYAEAAFRAFRDILDDGEVFPWESIVDLGQVIVDSPTDWSSHSRLNLAMLINRGIAAEETDFPEDVESEVQDILLVLLDDPDPDRERDQPSEGAAGHGDPVHVAINSVRPMALNAYITFLVWQDDQSEGTLDPTLFEPVEPRIQEDPSLAVRSVIGRRFGTLYDLDSGFVESHLDGIFPRSEDPTSVRRFTAAWNSYARKNYYLDEDWIRPCYYYAIRLLESNGDREYQIDIPSTAAHIASFYLFEDESFEDDESMISQFYNVASGSDAAELASVVSSSIGNTPVEERWDKIRELWEWRLSVADPDTESYEDEIWDFLSCVKNSSASTLDQEKELVSRSLPYITDRTYHWRQVEEWFAEQSDPHPNVAVSLYKELVDAVPCGEWSSTARTSQEENRSRLYRNAEATGGDTLQSVLDISDQFAAENRQMDREFLKDHLPK